MTSNLETAFYFADAGLHVMPCCPETKRPLIERWPDRATNNKRGIAYYWNRCGATCVPGIAAGKSGLIVIDLDVKGGVDGVGAFDQLINKHGELPACPVTLTPSGGYHLFFQQPPGCALGNSTGSLPRGIDVRGVGGQVIGPGAVMADGQFYESVAGWPDLAEAYAEGAIPVLPTWLQSIIATKPARLIGGPLPARTSPPSRCDDDSRAAAWAAAGLRDEAAALAATGVGHRNRALYDLVCTFAGHAANGWISKAEVYGATYSACVANGYLTSAEKNDGPQSFEKSFASGWAWGFDHPTHGPRERLIPDPTFVVRLKPRAA